MSYKKQTMYSRYYDAFTLKHGLQVDLETDTVIQQASTPLTGFEFLRLPYHERLRLAGFKIKLRSVVSCSELRHLPVGVALELPVLSKDELSEFRRDDVYLIGKDKESYPVFPFEYDIVW